MNTVRVETTVEADGELHLKDLPCRRGDKVEAILLILDQSLPNNANGDRDKNRAAAVDHYLELARPSQFHSTGPYPSRNELHERH